MLTPEQRRNLEAGLGREERALVHGARIAKSAVLLLLIASLAWIGISAETQTQDTAAPDIAGGSQVAQR